MRRKVRISVSRSGHGTVIKSGEDTREKIGKKMERESAPFEQGEIQY